MEPTAEEKIERALSIAFRHAGHDGAHHKMWTIDQMVRALTGDDYDAWVAKYEGPEDPDGDDRYEWDRGTPP